MSLEHSFGMSGVACRGCGYDVSRCICPPPLWLEDVCDNGMSDHDHHADDGYDDREEDWIDDPIEESIEAAYEGPSGCLNCGRYTIDCRCWDGDYWPEYDDESALDWADRHEAVTFEKFRPHTNRSLKVAIAQSVDDKDGKFYCNHSWKQSNRNARKQWARHERRLTKNSVQLHRKLREEARYAIEEAERYQIILEACKVVTRLRGRGGFNASIVRLDALNVLERFAA